MPDTLDNWAQRIRAGEVRAISRAITAIENHDPAADELLRSLFFSTGRAYMIGVTGAPGTGKSTLVDRLAAQLSQSKAKRSALSPSIPPALSPAAQFSAIAFACRATRSDEGIFIRSMATRGFLGGLARATADVSLLLDASGKEIIIIETVGVGQDEVDIVRLADCTLVVVVPGLGDDVQNMKAGLMEIGDIFVLNKSEREGADRVEQQLQAMLQLAPDRFGWHSEIVRTVATENRGVDALVAGIERFRKHAETAPELRARETDHWRRRLIEMLESRLIERLLGSKESEARLTHLAQQVAARKTDPYGAVDELLARGAEIKSGIPHS